MQERMPERAWERMSLFFMLLWAVLVAAAGIFRISESLPFGNSVIDHCGCIGDGICYVAENPGRGAWLYRINSAGVAQKPVRLRGISEEAEAEGILFRQGPCVLLGGSLQKDGKEYHAYQILCFGTDMALTEKSVLLIPEQEGELSGFSYADGIYFLTILTEGGRQAYVYGIDSADCMRPAADMAEKNVPEKETSDKNIERTAAHVVGGTPFKPADGRYFADARYQEWQFVCRLDDGSGAEGLSEPAEFAEIYKNRKVSFSFILQIMQDVLLQSMGVLVIGFLAIGILMAFLKGRSRTVYLIFLTEAVLFVSVAAGTGAVYLAQREAEEEGDFRLAGYYMRNLLKEQNGLSQMGFEAEDFYGSEGYYALRKGMADLAGAPGMEGRLYDLAVVRASDSQVLASISGRNGSRADTLYGEAGKIVVEQLSQGNPHVKVPFSIGHKNYDMAGVFPEGSVRAEYVLLGAIDRENTGKYAEELLVQDIGWGILAFLTASAALTMLLIVQGEEMKRLEEAMERLMDGLREELHYNKYRILKAYDRFAPKQIEKLLRKNSIAEVESGDVRNLKGTVAMVGMRATGLEGDKMAELLGRFIQAVEKQQEKGILISSNCGLSMIRILYPDGEGNPMAFGTGLSRDMQDDRMMNKMQAAILLYDAGFTYGVVGTNTQSFIFLQEEGACLPEKYLFWLGDMGLRLLATREVLQSGRGHWDTRYIGYIGEKQERTELYEILDVCPEQERKAKRKADEKFQKALALFYQFDFYLARSGFADVLKEAPQDKLSKWYLFTCEKYLDKTGGNDISCSLAAEG